MFAERLKKERKRNGFLQKELAQAVGVSQRRISYWENNAAVPDANEIVRLCKILGVSADYLLGLKKSLN